MTGNKDIAIIGKNTRFGSENGPDPKAAKAKQTEAGQGNQHSVRNALRRLAASDFVLGENMTPEVLVKKFGRNGVEISGAQMLAVRKFEQGMKNWKAMDSLIDAIDGKQVQKVVEAQATLADLVNHSYELENQTEEQADGEPARSSSE